MPRREGPQVQRLVHRFSAQVALCFSAHAPGDALEAHCAGSVGQRDHNTYPPDRRRQYGDNPCGNRPCFKRAAKGPWWPGLRSNAAWQDAPVGLGQTDGSFFVGRGETPRSSRSTSTRSGPGWAGIIL